MFFHLLKRFKPFALLVSLLVLSILYAMNSLFIVKCNNQVDVNILQPKLAQSNGHLVQVNKQISFLGEYFKQSLDQYEEERVNLRKRWKVVQKTPLHNHASHGKPNIVCSDGLFLLIQIHSSPVKFMSRQAIRLSWGSMDRFIGDQLKTLTHR